MTQSTPINSTAAHLAEILERLRQARHVAVLTHQRPDPDALGSQAAAACLLHRLGAKIIYLPQFADPPAPYRFLLESLPGEVISWSSEWAVGPAGTLDTILLVDTCTYQQLEPARDFLNASHDKVVALDHHASRDDVGLAPNLFTDTTAAACVEILWQLCRLAQIPLDQTIAQLLMAGLVGDTGWFRFDSVTPRTHLMASDLVAQVNPAALYERLMQNETKTKLALMQRALASLRWSFQDRFACMILQNSDFIQTGATQSQTEYLVDMPMTIQTVEVVALITEMPDGRVRASLRSKHAIDVNKICNRFTGGGHAKAAGCRLDGPLESAIAQLTAAVGNALDG